MHSFTTDPNCVTVERLHDHFTKFLLKDGVVLHRFTAAHDAHFHSHPFNMWSDVLTTGYWEEMLVPDGRGGYELQRFDRHPNTSHHIERGTIHRLGGFLDEGAPECWTLIHPYGERLPWHFYRLGEGGQLQYREPGAGPDDWHVCREPHHKYHSAAMPEALYQG